MISRTVILVGCVLVTARTAAAVEPMPTERRVVAAVAGYLSAPADTPMKMPTDVAVDSKGRAVVADGVSSRLVRFGTDGQFDATVAEFNGQSFDGPVGLTVDRADRVWLTDTGNHRLVVIDSAGKPVESINLPAAPDGAAADPTDVAVSRDGERTYVVDNNNHRLLIRDNKQQAWTAIGSAGRGLGQFEWPFMVAAGDDDSVYISDVVGARVQKLDPSGQWSTAYGRWGVQLGQLYRPKGVAVDASGRVYVSDSTLGVIQVFAPVGHVEGVLTNAEGLPLKFDHPMGICFDRSGRLYVVELTAGRVAVVELRETKPSSTNGKGGQP